MHVTGNCESDLFTQSTVVPLRPFVTRCRSSATTKRLTEHIVNKQKWNMMDIEKLKRKLNGYSSFRVTINRFDEKENEYLKPECWPRGIMVRLFTQSRQASFNDAAAFRVTQHHDHEISQLEL